MPALYKTQGGFWALLWETDVTPSYCNSRLSKASQLVYRIQFPNANEVKNIGAATPTWTLPWTMPWRIVITGTSPGTILESTLSTDLAAPSTIDDLSWIRPGRSSWSWWSANTSPRSYNQLKTFVDLAQQMTWEYSLADANWNLMTGGTWQELVTYAAEKNVGINLWYNSGGELNEIADGPRDRIYDSSARNTEFSTISAAGVKGVKIDFWLSDKQNIVKFYCDVFRDAAKYHLLVNPHGSTIPRGWQRTYPNLITAEAIRGAENYIWFKDDPARLPWQNTIVPFTRNAVASMDWTPVTFTNNTYPHLTTYAHELALSVVFESGIQHFADRVSGYTTSTISAAAIAFLQQVPTAWDDTKFLLGYPGSFVVLARRKGLDWYVGGITGDTVRSVTVPLSFLTAGSSYQMTRIADGASSTTFDELLDTVTLNGSFEVSMPLRGGFVAKIIDLNKAAINRIKVVPGMLSHGPVHFLVSGESFALPEYKGRPALISIYSLNGSLIKCAMVDKPLIRLKKDLSLPVGAYIVQHHH
jgi:alpha-glucosidase